MTFEHDVPTAIAAWADKMIKMIKMPSELLTQAKVAQQKRAVQNILKRTPVIITAFQLIHTS